MNVYLGSDCTKINEDLFIEIDQEIYITYQKKIKIMANVTSIATPIQRVER